MIITIDGLAGTGKTTIARKVAEALGYQYFDTGAMYRALTFIIIKKEIDLKDYPALEKLLKDFHFDIKSHNQEKRYFIDGEDVTEEIRNPRVTNFVSEVSALPLVRQALVAIQQEFGKKKNSVFEGRDMGTYVFPNADIKFYFIARAPVRAERRYHELKNKKVETTEEEVLKELVARDQFDSSREFSPLKQADDAILIDTSDKTIEQVVDEVLSLIKQG